MRKKKSMERLACAVLAAVLTVTGAVTPVTSLAAEAETSSLAVESETPETAVQEILSPSLADETAESVMESTAAAQTEAKKETVAQTTAEPVQTEVQTEATRQETAEKQTKEATVGTTAEAVTKEETAEAATKNETEKETVEVTTENETEKETVEVTTENETEAETVEVTTENETEEQNEELFTKLDPSTGFTEESLAGIDFSSRRLLIAVDSSVIIDKEHVLSVYNGVYLMQYETESQAKYAYAYYYGKSEFVDVDTVICVADGDNSANAAAPMEAGNDPIGQLREAVAQNTSKTTGAVAVIDTGVNGVANVTESVSMIGDNTADENGHGTIMAKLIAEQNPDVKIISIKALGADGTGDMSAVYAAIQYAIDKHVSVINLSMSAMGTAENAALTSIIDSAVKAGIAVVGAAGNKGMDVRFFVPGNIESAYIIGAADKNGARIVSSNYGATVDFNVVADSTSEATAKFSGYYTLNGAVADKKLVFPTDYVKEEEIDFDGPNVHHQISYYDYKGSMKDLVWIGQRDAKTILSDDGKYFTTYIGYVEDSAKVKDLDVCVDFMDTYKESIITKDCIVDLENMQVKIPTSYKDSAITVRWYMTNASYGYVDDVDAKYMMSDTPEPFKTAKNSNDSIAGLNLAKAKQYQQGTYSTAFTHTPASMNHCNVNYSLDSVKDGDYFKIEGGYIAIVDGYNNKRADILAMFGPSALQWYVKNNKKELIPADVVGQTFLTHFGKVTRVGSEEDVSYLFNSISGKGLSTHMINIDTNNDGVVDAQRGANLGWVFGTCAYDFLDGQVPNFEPGGQIICTNKDPDGTTYFFYYCRSTKAQWAGGSFSLTPVLPKTGFLRIHKSSASPALTNGNSCYNFTKIAYTLYRDAACTNKVQEMWLDKNGYSQPVELNPGTYYFKETQVKDSGYALDKNVHTVTVTAGTTFDSPQTWETTDQPLNDPFGISLEKRSYNKNITADMSGAEYTINYYAGQYNMDNLPAKPTTKWVIKTTKNSFGAYTARLDDAHIVSGSAVYDKSTNGMYKIPLGTITVQETKAPAGFTVKGALVKSAQNGSHFAGRNNVYLFNLVDKNSGVYLQSSNSVDMNLDTNAKAMEIVYSEQRFAGGISVQKYDAATKGKPVRDGASLAGIMFSIVNVSGHSIVNYAGNTIPNGAVAQVIVTDANGYASTGAYDLPEGTYIVQENRAGCTFDGKTFTDTSSKYANDFYLWDGQTSERIQINAGKVGTITSAGTFYDQLAFGGMYILKYDSVTKGSPVAGSGASLEGVRFAIIYNSDRKVKNFAGAWIQKGDVLLIVPTNKDGYAATENYDLPVGDYIVKELRMDTTYDWKAKVFHEGTSDYANYYYLWKNQQTNVTITENDSGKLVWKANQTFYDDLAYGGIKLQKQDSVTNGAPVAGSGASLEGIKFAIVNNNDWDVKNVQTGINVPRGKVVMVIETDKNGCASTGKYALPVGNYIVRELCMDASFDGKTLTEGTSGYANYFYYWQNQQKNVTIAKNQIGTLSDAGVFKNDLAYGGITLQKQDGVTSGAPVAGSGASLEGIKFAIVNNNDWDVKNVQTGINVPKGKVVMVIETDKNGCASTGKYALPVGNYIVRELRKDASFDGKNFMEGTSDFANYFYYWKDLRREVTINQAGTLADAGNFKDDLAYGGLYLYKYDSVTKGTPVSGSGATLAGIRFAIINNNSWDVLNTETGINVPKGSVVKVITTDVNGYAATGQYALPVGDYIVRELRTDATFDGRTLKEGSSKFANYFYYWKNQQKEVTITDKQMGTLAYGGTFYDDLAYGGLYVLKYDSVTKGSPVAGSGASLKDIRFAVINNNNWEVMNFDTKVNTPKGGVVMVIETNEDGYAATGNYALPVGDYIVKELRADATVEGTTLREGTSDYANYFYYWQDNKTNVSISRDDLGTLVWKTNQTFYDDLAYGGIKLQKQDSVTNGAPVAGSGANLDGIKFAIVNNNDWTVVNTKTGITTPKGSVVMVITTDENGYAATGQYALPAGNYIVRELRMDAEFDGTTLKEGTSDYANYFYYWKDQQKNVTIEKNQIGTLSDAGVFKNDLAYGGIKVQKYDSTTNGVPAEGSNVSLAGIKFAVVNNNDWNVVNHETGIVTPKGGVVMVIETDEDGAAATKEYALPVGNYIVRELRMDASFDGTTLTEGTSEYANNDYWWKDQEKSVAIEKNSIGTLVSAGTFYNVPVGGGIKLQKYDKTSGGAATGGRTLSGISFAVINNNNWLVKNYAGNLIGKGGVVQVITTDENGYAATGTHDLPLGNYIVRELRMDASFDGQQFSEGSSLYANDDYWWREQSVKISVTEKTAGILVWTDSFYDSPVYTPVPTGIILSYLPYILLAGGCIIGLIVSLILKNRKKKH